MAVTGLLALLDDVTAILDDVAMLSKVAAEKTAGIAGDDLAVNAEGLVGLDPARELPIVGRVALGSVANKAVLVPIALALPHAAIAPLLMIGGTFLCYEGVHKVFHKHAPEDAAHHAKLVDAVRAGPDALVAIEGKKIRQAIVTDIVLSAEIVAVALGAVADEPFATRAAVLIAVSVLMTVGIYGLVGLIVKLDDIGLHLQRSSGPVRRRLGRFLVVNTPALMKVISVVGTAAMFVVGGGIVLHGVPMIAEPIHHFVAGLLPAGWLAEGLSIAVSIGVGMAIGGLASMVIDPLIAVLRRVRSRAAPA